MQTRPIQSVPSVETSTRRSDTSREYNRTVISLALSCVQYHSTFTLRRAPSGAFKRQRTDPPPLRLSCSFTPFGTQPTTLHPKSEAPLPSLTSSKAFQMRLRKGIMITLGDDLFNGFSCHRSRLGLHTSRKLRYGSLATQPQPCSEPQHQLLHMKQQVKLQLKPEAAPNHRAKKPKVGSCN